MVITISTVAATILSINVANDATQWRDDRLTDEVCFTFSGVADWKFVLPLRVGQICVFATGDR
jgi:hypothetical protein